MSGDAPFLPASPAGRNPLPAALLYPVFLLSGFAAILYQLVWQRSLFRMFGTNMESVTLVVTAFMLGLGLGSLAGGVLSVRSRVPLPALFGLVELGIGAFGFCSLSFFRWIASWTSGASGLEVGAVSFAAVLIPTLLMGATLPLLVAYLVRRSGNVGRSVGMLYFINTLGSAAGCLAAALLILGSLGQTGSVRLAAGINTAVAGSVLLCYVLRRP